MEVVLHDGATVYAHQVQEYGHHQSGSVLARGTVYDRGDCATVGQRLYDVANLVLAPVDERPVQFLQRLGPVLVNYVRRRHGQVDVPHGLGAGKDQVYDRLKPEVDEAALGGGWQPVQAVGTEKPTVVPARAG